VALHFNVLFRDAIFFINPYVLTKEEIPFLP